MLKTLLKRGLRELGYEVRRPPVGEDAYALQRDILDESSPVIFDVGAHEGTVVRKYLGLFPRATIHAFEPTPAALRGLRAAFGADGRVHIHEVALSETEGTATIHKNLFGDTNSLLASDGRAKEYWGAGLLETADELSVRTTTVERVAAERGLSRIHILKLDVQGAELRVLKGAERLLREHRIDIVYCEVILAPTYVGQAPLFEYLRFFHELGYVLFSVHDLQRRRGQLLQMDALFVAPEIEARVRARQGGRS